MSNKQEYQYTIILEPQAEGGYTVLVPALPGCITEGNTVDEAMAMAQDAILGYIACLIEDGEPIPSDLPDKPMVQQIKVVA